MGFFLLFLNGPAFIGLRKFYIKLNGAQRSFTIWLLFFFDVIGLELHLIAVTFLIHYNLS